MMTFETLLYEVRDGVAIMTMNRPEARNALGVQAREEVSRLIPEIRGDKSVKALVITGAGGCFSGGGDVSDMKKYMGQRTPSDNRQVLREVNAWLPELVNLEKPAIAAVDGPAFGAGFNMALACDFVVCTPRATFLSGVRAHRAGSRFRRAVPVAAHRRASKSEGADVFGTRRRRRRSRDLGIVYRIVPPENLLDEALELANRFRYAPTEAIGITKNLLNQSFHTDQRMMGELEAFASMASKAVPYHREAVERFLAKEAPLYDWDRMDKERGK
jgi:2-(1,2-epoxy-1,2-dihydrophenyl)acetyl-CoA isomerase